VVVFVQKYCPGVTEFLEVVEPGDVDGFGGFFAFFGVQPVFGFGQRGEEFFFSESLTKGA
jgi:hypothetical protein